MTFTLTRPGMAKQLAALQDLKSRLEGKRHKGEAIMRECLALLIDSGIFEENAFPKFLTNPYTGVPLQFDRYYPPFVGFEFHGPQHDQATPRFGDPDVTGLRGRDYMKMGMCVELGITLVTIRAEDLSIEGIRQKIPPVLPKRDLTDCEPLVAHLDQACRKYRTAAARGAFTEA